MRRAIVLVIIAAFAGCVRTVVLDPPPDALPDAGVPDGPNPDVPADGSSPDVPHD